MSTRKFRFDSETGMLSPISVSNDYSGRVVVSSPSNRTLRLLFIVVALAASAFVFRLASAQAPNATPPASETAP